MEFPRSKGSSVASSPFSSPNIGALLKIRVISWSQETGLPVTVRVRVGDKIFNLHKHQLILKSGYFKRRLEDSTDLELPETFPGGPAAFETLTLLLYGSAASSSSMVDPFNVAALRCAAEFLEMTEDHFPGNLCDRLDLYLNQVVLQSWDDTLIVLQKSQALLPWSEELLIVSRCIESLAFMACMEILDPERRRDQPLSVLESSETTMTKELWIKDLIALPFGFFKRVVGSLRRQGMRERYVCPIVVFYANKWVISKKTRQFREISCDKVEDDDDEAAADRRVSSILRGVLDLLGDKASRYVPVGFYFVLLSRALEVGSGSRDNGCRAELEEKIAASLHSAQAKDFSVPVAAMERIVSRYVSSGLDQENQSLAKRNSVVAELWDSYVSRVALNPEMGSERFIELVERVPIRFRDCHDQLYAATRAFLRAHPNITQEERALVCKSLSCQRLSQRACIEVVQNESMPLCLIVQALFVQQQNTHRALKDCSESFRHTSCSEYSGSISLSKSPFGDGAEARTPAEEVLSRKEYESTSFRIQSLEQELVSLKLSLQRQKEEPQSLRDNRSTSKRSNPIGQVTNCIGSVSFASQWKCADRLLKIFRRVTLFGSKRLKATRVQ